MKKYGISTDISIPTSGTVLVDEKGNAQKAYWLKGVGSMYKDDQLSELGEQVDYVALQALSAWHGGERYENGSIVKHFYDGVRDLTTDNLQEALMHSNDSELVRRAFHEAFSF